MKSVSETNVARDKSEPAPTLQICLIPRTTWGNNVRSHVPNTTWRAIRRDVIRRAGEKCEACESQAGPLHCHEVFDFDTHQGLQRLVGLRALCSTCHGVVHIGRTLAREGKRALDTSLEHLARVNDGRKSKPSPTSTRPSHCGKRGARTPGRSFSHPNSSTSKPPPAIPQPRNPAASPNRTLPHLWMHLHL